MIYDMNKSFHENVARGPIVPAVVPFERVLNNIKLFDYSVLSPIGLFACPFSATSKGIALASQRGFDVITWKSIARNVREPHNQPNLSYVRFGENVMIATKEKT